MVKMFTNPLHYFIRSQNCSHIHTKIKWLDNTELTLFEVFGCTKHNFTVFGKPAGTIVFT
jgi:hypothetical protein